MEPFESQKTLKKKLTKFLHNLVVYVIDLAQTEAHSWISKFSNFEHFYNLYKKQDIGIYVP